MLRRLASLGHQVSEDQQPMSPSPGDEQPPHEAKTTGGLAGVFKGLAGGGKLTKSPPQLQPPFPPIAASQVLERSDAAPLPPTMHGLPPEHVELFGHLKNGQLGERIAAANSLRNAIFDFPLNPVLDIWYAAKDLIDPAHPPNARHAAWELLTECIKCPSSTDLERREYFETVTAAAHPEDFDLQLAALKELTDRGRNIAGFYYDIFPLLTLWLQDAYKAARTARRQASRGGSRTSKGKMLSSGEDKNLSQLFTLIRDVIKFNFKFATDSVVGSLMDMLLRVCMNTSVEDDLRACISVIDAVVTFGAIPNDKLKDCIQVLSSIHCLVPSLQKDSWHTISNICRSHHGQSTVRILLDLLRTYPSTPDQDKDKDSVRDVRGALSVLKKLLSKSPEKGYPAVPLALLIDGLATVSRSSSTRIANEILKLVNSLFDGPRGNINPVIAEEHWSPIFSVAAQCATKAVYATPAEPGASTSSPSTKEETESGDSVTQQLKYLVDRIETLLSQKSTDLLQRDDCIMFFTQVQQVLSDSAAAVVIAYFKEYRSCLPSEVDWRKNVDLILDAFYLNRSRDPITRLRALEVIVEVYDFLCIAERLVEDDSVVELVRRVLSGLPAEDDTLVLQETVTFLVNVAGAAGPRLFDDIVDAFKGVVAKEMSKSPLALLATPKTGTSLPSGQTVYFANQSLSNVVTRGYVQIFIRAMSVDGSKAAKAFNALVHIARSNSCELDARLTAMKMLFRLRADFEYQVYLTTLTENESLAGTLYRTESSLARKLAEDAAQPSRMPRADHSGSRPSRGISFSQGQTIDRGIPVRSASTPKPAIHQGQRLWSVPDADALPERPPDRPSWFVLSHRRDTSRAGSAVLNMSSWLDALLSLFHQGCNWEVYSFILVHLPAQLSNHPIFKDAIPYIQEFRRLFCEMVRMNSFHEPPNSSGLRRTDVANCLFHSLTMLLSYHQHFQKMDEDEIVRAFTHGIADKTAKTCIHALSVCCHELPLSVSKSLVTILQKMSQIITQPFVAMHILEFLACLSRLHSLYSNFREDEYRIVFGICIRYLQYAREKRHTVRGSVMSEPSTPSIVVANHPDILGQQPAADDLPQYVYALAYHVITFWFLALKMPDRPGQIGWIAKNLFTDIDGKASNEEQAQITLDFMQRVAFSDASDSAQDPLFNKENFGEIHQKRWIIGNSIITIRQAQEAGWAEITRRYPSGTSSFAIRVEFSPLANQPAPDGSDAAAWEGRFQHGITIFPSHLLMQLLAPMPQIYDPAIRPIPLPDEEAVDRAIRNFDRNSAVDSHKVGVIYIKEGQTSEAEILANTIGGPDYLEFLKNLGALTRLKGATFNTQGLDRENDADGKYTYCWRDRVTEIVFHVTTQMPTNPDTDPQCVMKKRHIGNDFVSIIWNDSGLPFKFDTFPSQFNYVYIVITPAPRYSFLASREMAKKRLEGGPAASPSPFFMVQVMSQPGFPEISPAAEPKIVSLKGLPSFVRLLALNASVFSLVWANREGGEHVSSWHSRLREINRLRERYGPKPGHHPVAPSPPPGSVVGGGSAGSIAASSVAAAAAAGLPVMGHAHGHLHHPQQGMGQQLQSNMGGGGIGGGESVGGSRPPSGMRDSFSSLRRSSVATFFTSASTDQTTTSHRSSMLSTATTENTEVHQMQPNTAEALVDSVDFSKWA
ncbi:Tuberous sclerosis 2 protein [Madurella mycetomatis]|uniref:Tuberous sclerosis 2 protein n=1 Tax=Madurella mycetomatis TaxID=100816 RepID=A0A175VT56_9PEZI|nr:Tuberous sclerosis 2 protein [Madurella mycetomatis]KXX80493.1 Tuberous sclerosis 2 protein [Madurella mycetomatis]